MVRLSFNNSQHSKKSSQRYTQILFNTTQFYAIVNSWFCRVTFYCLFILMYAVMLNVKKNVGTFNVEKCVVVNIYHGPWYILTRWRCTLPFIVSFDIVKMAAAVTSRLTAAVCRQFQRVVTVSSHTQPQYATQAFSKFHSCQRRYLFLADYMSGLNVSASW